jgi:hypothetical protein
METTTRHAREATRARRDVAAYIAIRVRATTTTTRTTTRRDARVRDRPNE